MTLRVLARVLVKNSGEDEFDLVILVDLIGEGVPIITTVPNHSLMELGGRALGLIDTGQNCDKDKVGVVKGVLGAFFEFLLERLGGKFGVCRDGPEIGNDAEDALGLLAG